MKETKDKISTETKKQTKTEEADLMAKLVEASEIIEDLRKMNETLKNERDAHADNAAKLKDTNYKLMLKIPVLSDSMSNKVEEEEKFDESEFLRNFIDAK